MSKKTITLKIRSQVLRKEYQAGSTIVPGMLVGIDSSNLADPHASAASNHRKCFAVEDDLQGNDIDDNYTSDNMVQVNHFAPGEEVYAWLQAESDAVVIGDALESAGDGRLRKHVTPDLEVSGGAPDLQLNQIVGYALEAVDVSDSGSSASRIEIEIA